MNKHQELEKKLGLKFKNPGLLQQALTHRSYLNETAKNLSSNERLEFLGDAVLGFTVSNWLYEHFPDFPEGKLTNLRSALVKSDTLAQIAQNLGLGDFIMLSKGESESGGQKNPVLLANCLEAIVGAIFLDQGIETAKKFIKTNLQPILKNLIQQGEFKDYKSLLQESLQAKTKHSPVYKTVKEEGPDHEKIFTVGVYSEDRLLTTSKGKSKQEAEQAAAKLAIEKLNLKK